MRRAKRSGLVLIAFAMVVGCAPGRSALDVTVEATGTIVGVDHLQVDLTDTGGRHAGPYTIAVDAGMIPPSVDFTLAFGKDVKGTVDIVVAALDATGGTLASSAGKANVAPSHTNSVTITLMGGVVLGDGGSDLAVVPGHHLVFSAPPTNGTALKALAPVTVTLTDGSGATVPGSDTVTLAVSSNAAGARLDGVVSAAAVNGVATFDNIAVDRDASGLTLVATAPAWLDGMSTKFDVAGSVWQPLYGLNGGTAIQLVFAPSDSMSVVAVSAGNTLFKSSDGGVTWYPLAYGLGKSAVASAAFDPGDSATIYVGTDGGVFKSTNGGLWFTNLVNSPPVLVSQIVVDPKTHSTLYLRTGDSTVVYKSTDGGMTFAPANTGLSGLAYTLLVDPNNPNNLATGTSRSIDGGAHWMAATKPVPIASSGTYYGSAVDPTTPGVAYVGYLKTTDFGDNWNPLPAQSPDVPAESIAVDPKQPNTIYFAGLSSLHGGVAKTTDGGQTYTTLKTVQKGFLLPQALAMDPNDGAKLLFSAPDVDIIRSIDAGATWTTTATGFACVVASSVSIDPRTPSDVYLGTVNHGVLRSKDTGQSWTTFSSGLPSAPVTTVIVDPVTAGRMFAGLNLGTASASMIWKADAGSWVDAFGPMVAPVQIVFDTKLGEVLYAIGSDGNLYSTRSAAWASVTVATGCVAGVMAADPSTADKMYVTCNGTVYRGSAASGFTKLNNTVVGDQGMAIDFTAPSTIYVLMSNGSTTNVNKTTDAFTTVNTASTGLTSQTGTMLVMDPLSHLTLYAVGDRLFKTIDGAATWSAADSGLPLPVSGSVKGLALDPITEGVAYAATTCGVYKTSSGGK